MIGLITNEIYDHDMFVFHKTKPQTIVKKMQEQGFWLDIEKNEALKWATMTPRTKMRVLYHDDQPRAVVFGDMKQDVGTLAHEAFHITYALLNSRGLELSSDSEEAYAYCIDWYTKQLGMWCQKTQR